LVIISIFFRRCFMATYTQMKRNGLYELTDASRKELVSSKYFNEDLAPTSVAERTWTTYNISMLWVGMSICIPSLALASGLIGMGVSPWMAVLNVALGNVIILVPIQMNSHIGTKYGIPFPLFARMTFGTKGAHLPAILRGVTACGWTAVQAWVGGGAVAAVIGIFAKKFADQSWTMSLPSWGGMQTVSTGTFIGYVLFMLFVCWVAYKGLEQIKWVQNIGGPILIVVMIALLIWSASQASNAGYGFWDVMNQSSDQALLDSNGGLALVYLGGLMGNIAFWATMALNIPDFSRYAKSQKSQFRGQLYGMPIPMAACAFIGAYFAQATKVAQLYQNPETGEYEALFDPTGVFYYIDNPVVVFIAAFGVVMATITTCVAANVVAPANGFSNISPKRISYKRGVLIAVFIAFFILQAWWIYGSGGAFFTWMNAYGSILAPIAAIFIADYFVVKKQRVDVAGLFRGVDGRYWYSGGINWAAVIAWVVSFIFPLLTYFGASGGFFVFVNSISYIWSFVLGFVVYVILMKTSMAGNSYLTQEEYDAFTDEKAS
jgi:NCS1 family nucleobase:cation symporter-1